MNENPRTNAGNEAEQAGRSYAKKGQSLAKKGTKKAVKGILKWLKFGSKVGLRKAALIMLKAKVIAIGVIAIKVILVLILIVVFYSVFRGPTNSVDEYQIIHHQAIEQGMVQFEEFDGEPDEDDINYTEEDARNERIAHEMENQLEYMQRGYVRAKVGEEGAFSNRVDNFFDYVSRHSFYLWLDENGDGEYELFSSTESDIRDGFDTEEDFLINKHLLFMMNEKIYYNDYLYPEAFAQPVFFDEEEFALASILDERGRVIPSAQDYKAVSGERVEEDNNDEEAHLRKNSVADIGLGTVFKYKQAEISRAVKGEIIQRDYWDTETNTVKTRDLETPEPFEYEVPVPEEEQEIYIIEKAVTFVGDFSFEYETQEVPIEELRDNSENEIGGANNEPVVKVFERTHYETGSVPMLTRVGGSDDDEEGSSDVGDDVYLEAIENGMSVNEAGGVSNVPSGYRPMYQANGTIWMTEVKIAEGHINHYRTGHLYETRPFLTNVEQETEVGEDYFTEYVGNFEAFLPENVLDPLDFHQRTGVQLGGIEDFNVGELADSDNVANCMARVGPDIAKYGDEFGVDPYLILAILAQESGGCNPRYEGRGQKGGGIAQFTAGPNDYIKANNLDVYNNPSHAVHALAELLGRRQEEFNGNVIMAAFSHNRGAGGARALMKMAEEAGLPTEGATPFLDPIVMEKARQYSAAHDSPGNQSYASKGANYDCVPEEMMAEVKSVSGVANNGTPYRYAEGFTYGDPCYLPNILRYYAGDIEDLAVEEGEEGSGLFDTLGSLVGSIGDFFGFGGGGNLTTDYDEDTPRFLVSSKLPEKPAQEILTWTSSFLYRIPLSLVGEEDTGDLGAMAFWDDDFIRRLENRDTFGFSASGQTIEDIIGMGESLKGTSYLWGGATNPNAGLDCSGLFWYILNELGFRVGGEDGYPRVTYTQQHVGVRIDSASDLQRGDMIFLDTLREGSPGHVAMYLGDGMTLHSGSSMGVSKISLDHWVNGGTFMFGRRVNFDEFKI